MHWGTKKLMWLALLGYLLDCCGLEFNLPHFWGMPVIYSPKVQVALIPGRNIYIYPYIVIIQSLFYQGERKT